MKKKIIFWFFLLIMIALFVKAAEVSRPDKILRNGIIINSIDIVVVDNIKGIAVDLSSNSDWVINEIMNGLPIPIDENKVLYARSDTPQEARVQVGRVLDYLNSVEIEPEPVIKYRTPNNDYVGKRYDFDDDTFK